MGSEHRGKGVDVQLGPVAGPLGRDPEGGRNWEGFSPDPVLTGVSIAETIKGIQDAGVIACAKHYILVSRLEPINSKLGRGARKLMTTE
jgi:beta-glucosidase-like glycosyl hydrolase